MDERADRDLTLVKSFSTLVVRPLTLVERSPTVRGETVDLGGELSDGRGESLDLGGQGLHASRRFLKLLHQGLEPMSRPVVSVTFNSWANSVETSTVSRITAKPGTHCSSFFLFSSLRSILCLKSADIFPMLDDVTDDSMEGIDLIPLRIDLAPLLFELDKQFGSHDVAVLFARCKRQAERARAYVVYVVSLFEMRDDNEQ
jgi:hypothetical protein